MLEERVWCIWVGNQEMSEQRKRCFDMIQQTIGAPVTLVTDANLHEYVLKDHPFHEAYPYLSSVMKCDYVRAYCMNQYGGGYTDIKQTFASWRPYFQDLRANEDKWICGYKEPDVGRVALQVPENKELQERLFAKWEQLIGVCSCICKPRTPFTEEWMANIHSVLDRMLPQLKERPANHPRDAFQHWIHGSYSTYPLYWAQICSCIVHPLCLKYSERILNTLPPPLFEKYM